MNKPNQYIFSFTPGKPKLFFVIQVFFFMLYGIVAPQAVYSQESAGDTVNDSIPQPFQANLKIIGKYVGDSVILRWAPSTPGAWSYGNKSGYTIERSRLGNDSLFNPENFEVLTSEPVKLLPLEAWEPIVKKDPTNFAAVAAQSIYGKSQTAGQTVLAMADEYQNKYSFALLAADLSAPAARAMGLRYTDRTIQKGQNYIYRVFVSQPSDIYKIDTAYLHINTSAVEILPPPRIARVNEEEYKITLFWEKQWHALNYTAYYIERSADKGKTYQRLNQQPYLFTMDERMKAQSDWISFADTLDQNYVAYLYRLRGITPLGELSDPSDPVHAMGRDKTPPLPPVNVEANSLGGSRVKISWEISEPEPDLKGFFVGRSNSSSEGFEPLFEDPLPVNAREYIDEHADVLTANYYLVAAVDTAGNGSVSMVSYGMIVDSIPPAPPSNIAATIDTSGIVTLSWSFGKEPDLAGYMVYFTNSPDHTLTAITNRPYQDTVFTDTIQVKTLTEHIYYRLKAVDVNYNYSAYSELIEVKRPDLIPPTKPVIRDYNVSERGIALQWITSSSDDVAGYVVYKKTNDGPWEELMEYGPVNVNTVLLTDEDVQALHYYTYAIESFDDDGNRSGFSYPVKLRMIDFSIRPSVTNVKAKFNKRNTEVDLQWSYKIEGDYRFILYKSVNGSNFFSFKTIPGNEFTYTDKDIKEGLSYEYTVKVQYGDGKSSGFSEIVNVFL